MSIPWASLQHPGNSTATLFRVCDHVRCSCGFWIGFIFFSLPMVRCTKTQYLCSQFHLYWSTRFDNFARWKFPNRASLFDREVSNVVSVKWPLNSKYWWWHLRNLGTACQCCSSAVWSNIPSFSYHISPIFHQLIFKPKQREEKNSLLHHQFTRHNFGGYIRYTFCRFWYTFRESK